MLEEYLKYYILNLNNVFLLVYFVVPGHLYFSFFNSIKVKLVQKSIVLITICKDLFCNFSFNKINHTEVISDLIKIILHFYRANTIKTILLKKLILLQ